MISTLKVVYPQVRAHIMVNIFLAVLAAVVCTVYGGQIGLNPKLIPMASFALYTPLALSLSFIPALPVVQLTGGQIMFFRLFWLVSLLLILALTLVVFFINPMSSKIIMQLTIVALSVSAFSFLKCNQEYKNKGQFPLPLPAPDLSPPPSPRHHRVPITRA